MIWLFHLGDVAVGNVLQPGAGATMSRMAMFEAGFPDTVPVYAVNRQCASGLQSIASIAASISRYKYLNLYSYSEMEEHF